MPYTLVVSGPRDWKDALYVNCVLDTFRQNYPDISKLICGDASGVDSIAVMWAIKNCIPYEIFHADWDEHGKSAGPIRNAELALEGELLVAFRYPNHILTPGTTNMVKQMLNKSKIVYVSSPYDQYKGETSKQNTLV